MYSLTIVTSVIFYKSFICILYDY